MPQELEWIETSEIKSEHINLPVRQVYLWLVTSNNKIPIVLGRNGYQLPGGKPEKAETTFETIKREMLEETGIDITRFDNKPIQFGYYLSKDDPNWPEFPLYLKLRFYLVVKESSEEIEIFSNEKPDEKDKMTEVKFSDIFNLVRDIPWVIESAEYSAIINLLKKL